MMDNLQNDAAQRAIMEQKLADEKLAFEAKLQEQQEELEK